VNSDNNPAPSPAAAPPAVGAAAPVPAPAEAPAAATNVQGSGKEPADTTAAPAKKSGPMSTQESLQISQIRDGMLIMKDGSFRAVVACESINFDLMSATEKDGVEYSYQNFLNSLYFATQILIRSQRVDIGPYLQRLADIRRGQDNMLLNVLMDDYMQFIDILSQEANIMDKSFYIVIQYASIESIENAVQQSKGFFKKLFNSGGSEPVVTRIDRATYDKAVTEVNNRIDLVVNGLFQMGVHSVRLSTKELSTLFYNFYNPDTAVHEPLGDFSKITNLYVTKGEGEPPKPEGAA
jgi:hypothetical protein